MSPRGGGLAAVALHALLFVLAAHLDPMPGPLLPDLAPLCTLELAASLPGPSEPAAKPAPRPAPRPAPQKRTAAPAVKRPAPAPQPPPPAPPPVLPGAAADPPESSGPGQAPADMAPAGRSAGAAPGADQMAPDRGGRDRDFRGYEVAEVDVAPCLLRGTPPEYPAAARRRKVSGAVTVRFLVDERGEVGEVAVLSAEPPGVFEQSVRQAVRRWRFSPGQRAGRPAPTWVVLPVRFDLDP